MKLIITLTTMFIMYLVFDVVFLEEFEEFLVSSHVPCQPPILPRLIGMVEGCLTTAHTVTHTLVSYIHT